MDPRYANQLAPTKISMVNRAAAEKTSAFLAAVGSWRTNDSQTMPKATTAGAATTAAMMNPRGANESSPPDSLAPSLIAEAMMIPAKTITITPTTTTTHAAVLQPSVNRLPAEDVA